MYNCFQCDHGDQSDHCSECDQSSQCSARVLLSLRFVATLKNFLSTNFSMFTDKVSGGGVYIYIGNRSQLQVSFTEYKHTSNLSRAMPQVW